MNSLFGSFSTEKEQKNFFISIYQVDKMEQAVKKKSASPLWTGT